MIVLFLVVILWIAVLVPSVYTKWSERRSAGSIGRFHQRLDLLERTGPKLVEPAYRLTGTESRSASKPLIVPISPPPVRPSLRLLPGSDGGSVARSEGRELVMVMDREDPIVLEEFGRAEELTEGRGAEQMAQEHWGARAFEHAARERRRLARRRRRNVFALLCGLSAVTALMGLAHPLRAAWVMSGLFVVMLVAFIALAVHGQRIEAEHRHLSRLGLAERSRIPAEDRSRMITYLVDEEFGRYEDPVFGHYEVHDDRLVAEG